MSATNKMNHPDEDSDLQDLLTAESESKSESNAANSSATPKLGLSNYYNHSSSSSSSSSPSRSSILFRIPELLCYYGTSFALRNPRIGKCMTIGTLVLIVSVLLNLSSVFGRLGFSGYQSIGVINYDFTSIHSELDFDIGKIDHWCITGNDNDCMCPDPLHPTSRLHRAWHKSVHSHADVIQERGQDADVVFLGQSLVELMNGHVNGNDMTSIEYFARINHIFKSKFDTCNVDGNANVNANADTDTDTDTDLASLTLKEDNTSNNNNNDDTCVNGLPLGLTGDASSNVLWRLVHGGELPDNFDPPIWWLVIGMEDIGKYACSEEITVMGILRIVEFILAKRPHAKIMINSLLPMTTMRSKEIRPEEEFIDAERAHGKGPHEREPKRKPKPEHSNDHDTKKKRKWKNRGVSDEWKNKTKKGGDANANTNANGDRDDDRGTHVRKVPKNKNAMAEAESKAAENARGQGQGQGQGQNKKTNGESKWVKNSGNGNQKKKFDKKDGQHGKDKNKDDNHTNQHHSDRMLRKSKPHQIENAQGHGEGGDNEPETKEREAIMIKREHDLEKRTRKYEKQVKHDEYNPTMKMVTKYHKRHHAHNHFDGMKLPMWSAIHEINDALHSFCQRTHNVSFFDATRIFTERNQKGDYILLTDLISPRGHPTNDGFKLWNNAMYEEVLTLKQKRKAAEGDNVLWKMNNVEYYDNGGLQDNAYIDGEEEEKVNGNGNGNGKGQHEDDDVYDDDDDEDDDDDDGE